MVDTSSASLPNTLSLYRYKRTNKSYTEDLGNGVKLTLMLIPTGEFVMGAPGLEPESNDNERPKRWVKVAQFLMGRFPVTQAQWREVAGYASNKRPLTLNPSRFEGDYRPVENVSWNDAREFCKRLSKRTGKDYRLPSEAQWEYACRAGTETPFHFGEMILPELANYQTQSSYNYTEFSYINNSTAEPRNQTTDVGSFPANNWGVHDMHGNVLEWCEDDYHSSYTGAPNNGSAWVERDRTQTGGVLRGGSWRNNPGYCRSANRNYFSRSGRGNNIGFRVCCVLPKSLLSPSHK